MLAQIVSDAVEERLDRDAYDKVLQREKRTRTKLIEELRLIDGDWEDDDGDAP